MSQIPELMGGRRLSHDVLSDKGFYTTGVGGKVQIFSDFFGNGALPLAASTGSGASLFVNQDTSSSGAPTFDHLALADGVYRMKFSSDTNAEKLTLYLGDDCCIPPTKNPIFEARVKITGTMSADDRIVIGLASARNATLDSIDDHVWFKIDGGVDASNILVEGDDNGTTDNNDNDTGKDFTSGTFHTFKIDMSDLSDVKFYVDGDGCALPEKMDVSGMAAGDLLQPYIEMQKDGGAVEHSVDVDYISVLWDRS